MKVSEEVMEAMQRALEKDGFLQGIRAKLRSNVAKIIKEGDAFHRPTPSNMQFMKSQKGQSALLVVREFLLKLDLKESLLVLEAEAGCQPFKEVDYLALSKKLELPDHDVSLLEQLIDNRSDHATNKPTSPIHNKQPVIDAVPIKPVDIQPAGSAFTAPAVKSASPKSHSNNHNYPSTSHSAKSTIVEESSFEEADEEVEEEEFEPVDDAASAEKAPSISTQSTVLVAQAKPLSPVSPKSPLVDLPPLKGASAKSTGSMLGALPDLKVPSRFNLTASDAIPALAAAKDSKDDDKDDGPEIDSEIEEEEEEPEEKDFSQLDQEPPEAKHTDEKHGSSGPNSRAVVVDNKLAPESNQTSGAVVGRANVQRVEAGSRSTRGWNLPADDDQQDFEDSREDEGEHSVDQTQSASLARGPGRRTFPPRRSPQPAVPGRSQGVRSSHDSDALDMSSSQQLSVMEDIEDCFDEESHHSNGRGQQSHVSTSRRSNQEEEDDDEVDQTNDHDEDDNAYDLDGEDEFGDDDELPIGGYQPTSRTSTAPVVATAPAKLFTTSNNNTNTQNDSKVNASAAEEEYGDDDFEQDEVMEAEEEEEIPSIMEEEEELSVGGQSHDDNEEDWKKSSVVPAVTKKDNGSMFQQRTYAAPAASSTTARKHDFSALNDNSDDEDDGYAAASVKSGGAAAATAEAKRLAEIDRQLQQMEKDDSNLRKIREDYGSSHKGKAGGILPDVTGDEISVASDSMVESFNADED